MVHVKKCPCLFGRGNPSTEFFKGEEPQIYCCGWIDQETDELIKECQSCADHVSRAEQDFADWLEEREWRTE